MNISSDRRADMEKAIVNCMFDAAFKNEWLIVGIDAGDGLEFDSNRQSVFNYIFDVDSCTVVFKKSLPEKRMTCSVVFVLGNDGYDCIADHSMQKDFVAEVMKPCDDLADLLSE